MQGKAIVFIFGILISSTISQTAVETLARTETIHINKYPLFTTLPDGATIDAFINTLTPLATTATEATNLYDTLAAIVTFVTTDAINKWKEAVKANSVYQNFASGIATEETNFQKRLTDARNKMKEDMINPPVRKRINETIVEFSKIENFIRFLNHTNRQVVGNLTRVDEWYTSFLSQAPPIIQENGAIVKQISEFITTKTTELNTQVNAQVAQYSSGVTTLIACTQTFAASIDTMLDNYNTNVVNFYDNFKAYRACGLTIKATLLTAATTEFNTANTAALTELTTDIPPIVAKVDELQTLVTARIATVPPADVTAATTLGKGLWNILIQARDNVEYFEKESKRFEDYSKEIREKLLSDFSNAQTAWYMFETQLNNFFDQTGNSLQAVRRVREAYTKVSELWGYWSHIFDERTWTSIAAFGITSAANLNLNGFKFFAYDLKDPLIYVSNVKVKQVRCFLTHYVEELQFAFNWVEDAAATPPSFKIQVAVNKPNLANENLKCGVIYDTSVVANQVGTVLTDITAANTAYDAITVTSFTP